MIFIYKYIILLFNNNLIQQMGLIIIVKTFWPHTGSHILFCNWNKPVQLSLIRCPPFVYTWWNIPHWSWKYLFSRCLWWIFQNSWPVELLYRLAGELSRLSSPQEGAGDPCSWAEKGSKGPHRYYAVVYLVFTAHHSYGLVDSRHEELSRKLSHNIDCTLCDSSSA